MTTTQHAMTVGELSRRTGISVKNLRQYADDGLIYTIGRSPTGYRLFDTDALWCAHKIGELRGLGLTIAEIRELTSRYLDRGGRAHGPLLADVLRTSRDRLRARITELENTVARIDEFEARHGRYLADAHRWPDDPRCAAGA
ncbi:MAG: MerR family transcriptional regulator [Thermoleophilaceae bacterium]